jgi:hypothetical protein
MVEEMAIWSKSEGDSSGRRRHYSCYNRITIINYVAVSSRLRSETAAKKWLNIG